MSGEAERVEAHRSVPVTVLSALIEAANECAEDLKAELDARYAGMLDHPAMKRRYDRDMSAVLRLQSLTAALEEQKP